MNDIYLVCDNILDRALPELFRRLKKCEDCNKEKMAGCRLRCHSGRNGMDYFGLDRSQLDVSTVYCKCSSGQRTWYVYGGRQEDKEEKTIVSEEDSVQ